MVWKTVGQSQSIERISRALNLKRLSHAYLICGMDGVGKLTFALDIAKIANCLDIDEIVSFCFLITSSVSSAGSVEGVKDFFLNRFIRFISIHTFT